MALWAKIDIACVQMFGALWGSFAAECRSPAEGTAVSNTRQSWYCASFLLLFFTIRLHLDHPNNQNPQYGWHKDSNLECLKISVSSLILSVETGSNCKKTYCVTQIAKYVVKFVTLRMKSSYYIHIYYQYFGVV